MNTKRVYIGEVFEKNEKEDRRIGYMALYYDPKKNKYCLLNNLKYQYEIDRNCTSYGSKYINKNSLIPYESFSRKPILFGLNYGTISYNCRLQVDKMIKERTLKLYQPNYTNNEIKVIHEHGNLTLDEKATEIMEIGLCFPENAMGGGMPNCKKYQNCFECTHAVLFETGKKEFNPFFRKNKMDEQGPTLVKK